MDAYLTLAEAADVLRIPRQSLQRLAKAGQIGHIRVGKQYRFAAADLEDYDAANRVHAEHMGRSSRSRRAT